MDLQDKHALVTGGGTGIGLDIARGLAAKGARVTITGRRLDVLEAAAKDVPGLFPMAMDVSDENSVRSGIANAAKARGPVEICVANAGIAEGQPFEQVTMDDWRRMMATNLDGVFVTLQAALATLPEHSPGRMIVMSSIAGVKGLNRAIPYTVSKHGIIGLIRGLAVEYVQRPITFNAICPGYVETDIVRQQVPKVMARQGVDEDTARSVFAAGNAHNTLLQVDEITAAALWLCSDGARSVNGQTIEIAGGQVST